MSLLHLRDIHLAFGDPPLFDGLELHVGERERVCLLGRNGAGKTTLFRLITGDVAPERGEIQRAQGLRVAALDQRIPTGLSGTVSEQILEGSGPAGAALLECHRLQQSGVQDGAVAARLQQAQGIVDNLQGWDLERQARDMATRIGLDPEAGAADLSAGQKRRVLLARALMRKPDLLLLDEPTNHLDLAAIEWLEGFLARLEAAVLFITHDRMFLRRTATRIVELDRGRLFDFPCGYDAYLERRQAQLEVERTQDALFDKKLAEEEAWIRRGVKARRTRNEGRVRALQALRQERAARRSRPQGVRLAIQEAERSGHKVMEISGIAYAWAGAPVFRDFSALVLRGDRIGIMGPNGCGKSTLLKVMLGQLAPQAGTVTLGTRLQPAYFDQLHEHLDEDRSVQENVLPSGTHLTINGQHKHILGYLQDFLFTPERARGPVTRLSGGERNRLMLARLFTRPSNLLVLDEPTNDLDAETLDLLEEHLLDYAGTVLLVSHDRAFLNSICTSVFVFEGQGRVVEYIGGYDDWLRQRPAPAPEPGAAPEPSATPPKRQDQGRRREIDAVLKKIAREEEARERIHARMAEDGFYLQAPPVIEQATRGLKDLETRLAALYADWEALEGA